MLISADLYRHLTIPVKALLRQIDCVTFKGSKIPTEIFTIDLDLTVLEVGKSKALTKEQAGHRRTKIQKQLEAGSLSSGDIFNRSR